MLKSFINLLLVVSVFLVSSCNKNNSVNNSVPSSNVLGVFSATVNNRLATNATVSWSPSVNSYNADTVKYKFTSTTIL